MHISISNIHGFKKICCFSIICFYFTMFGLSSSVQAKSNIDLTFAWNSISSNSDTQSIFCALNGKFLRDNDSYGISKIPDKDYYSPYSLNIKSSLHQSREDDLTTNFRQYNNLQINYYINRLAYIFSDLQFLTDRALNISDEISAGIGGGYSTSDDEERILTLQAGVYSRTSVKTELFSLMKSHFCWPLFKEFSLSIDNNLDINLDQADDYRLSNLDSLKIMLHKNFSFETGFEINYNNLVDVNSGAVNTTRRLFAGLNLSF